MVSVFLVELQTPWVIFVDVQSFLLFVNSTLMFSKVFARLFVAGGDGLMKVAVGSNVGGDTVMLFFTRGLYRRREFSKGLFPIKQSSSYCGIFSLNHRFEFLDQESKFDHFFISAGVIWSIDLLSLIHI